MSQHLQLNDFDFALPPELIAQQPLSVRSASRLLVLDSKTGAIGHHKFSDLPNFLSPNDLLIGNNTRVINARLFGFKLSGGKLEIMLERICDEHEALAQIKGGKKLKLPCEIIIGDEQLAIGSAAVFPRMLIKVREGEFFRVRFLGNDNIGEILQRYGHIPLPPYITRADESFDEERYQTIFARRAGAVAAPTASLHFDEAILGALRAKGIETAFITLHVGAGTFQPVRMQDIASHKMHSEYMEITPEVCAQIKRDKERGGRIVALGTTSVRALETAAHGGEVQPFAGETDIFIRDGFHFNCVDAFVTNFHLPKSTLLMLVAAFAGYDNTMRAYRAAVAARYRFFSYGDAMLVVK